MRLLYFYFNPVGTAVYVIARMLRKELPMKIKKLIAMKEECENKIECLELAISSAAWYAPSGEKGTQFTSKITLTPEQAQDIYDLLNGYRELLTMVIDSAEVSIG